MRRREASRGVVGLEWADADLQTFTGKAVATLGRKSESATERIVLSIERRGGTVDGFEGSNVLVLWTESVMIGANRVRDYYL